VIDIIFLGILGLAAFKGFSRGLVMAVFSFASLFVGLAAALKLSSVVAQYLKRSDVLPSQWWPFIAFILVFLAAIWIVRLAGGIVQKTIELSMLGWLNRIGGFFVYAVLYLLMFSVALFYLGQLDLLSDTLKSSSVTYAHIAPWGPFALSMLGKLIPAFNNVFSELQSFFERAGGRIGS
jgi:membrane protein required for colicin V production